MNRGIARRTVFESAADVRKFLALLTCASRRARIKVYAYTFMLSHFHLLVRSLDGQLSETMRLGPEQLRPLVQSLPTP
ncbi:MAG: transposase [Planctomycetes bacterium]|nr:transposase [Planctomycetota bacterium]